MIPIDEQIVHQRKVCDFRKENVSILNATVPDVQESILASLERLKKIDAVQVPEGKLIPECSYCGLTQAVTLESYNTLRDLLKRIVMEELK